MTSRDFQERLARRARHAGVSLEAGLAQRLETYFRLLATWNQKINLTALPLADPPPDTLDRLLIEPLVAATHVGRDTRRMLDIGSGGGSPAIPMALALPGIELRMVEAKTRKSVFLLEAIRALGLRTAEVFTARTDDLHSNVELLNRHELITIRAVRTEPRLLASVERFLRPGGCIFLFRSADTRLMETVSAPLSWYATYPLIDAARSRLVILRKQPTAERNCSTWNSSQSLTEARPSTSLTAPGSNTTTKIW